MAERDRERDKDKEREREREGEERERDKEREIVSGREMKSEHSTAINDSFSSDCKSSTCNDFLLCFHISMLFCRFPISFPPDGIPCMS